jgi:hypothetical protein
VPGSENVARARALAHDGGLFTSQDLTVVVSK